jgi:acetate kinase
VGPHVRLLAVNAGSSSLKMSVVEGGQRRRETTIELRDGRGDTEVRHALTDLLDEGVDAVVHRVVHGGPHRLAPQRVDDDLLDDLEDPAGWGSLHNPAAAEGIRRVRELLPDAPDHACFDTTFHADLPAAAATYALPREWNREHGLRRFGAHGLSHAYAVRRGAELVGRSPDVLRVVTCHLGSGSSLAAVAQGRCLDTSMGLTPLAGVVMRTRSGTVDPGLLLWLLRHGGLSLADVEHGLEHDAGLAGLSGTDGDLRTVLEARGRGDEDAALAYDVLVHSVRRELGAMVAATHGLDLLVFTGGIGEHSARLRADVVDGVAHLGLHLQPGRNEAAGADAVISPDVAIAQVVVVTAGEDLEMARQVVPLLEDAGTDS